MRRTEGNLVGAETFVEEFLDRFEACADLGEFGSLAQLLVEWRNTASLHAEGRAGRLKEPIPKVSEFAVRRP